MRSAVRGVLAGGVAQPDHRRCTRRAGATRGRPPRTPSRRRRCGRPPGQLGVERRQLGVLVELALERGDAATAVSGLPPTRPARPPRPRARPGRLAGFAAVGTSRPHSRASASSNATASSRPSSSPSATQRRDQQPPERVPWRRHRRGSAMCASACVSASSASAPPLVTASIGHPRSAATCEPDSVSSVSPEYDNTTTSVRRPGESRQPVALVRTTGIGSRSAATAPRHVAGDARPAHPADARRGRRPRARSAGTATFAAAAHCSAVPSTSPSASDGSTASKRCGASSTAPGSGVDLRRASAAPTGSSPPRRASPGCRRAPGSAGRTAVQMIRCRRSLYSTAPWSVGADEQLDECGVDGHGLSGSLVLVGHEREDPVAQTRHRVHVGGLDVQPQQRLGVGRSQVEPPVRRPRPAGRPDADSVRPASPAKAASTVSIAAASSATAVLTSPDCA